MKIYIISEELFVWMMTLDIDLVNNNIPKKYYGKENF